VSELDTPPVLPLHRLKAERQDGQNAKGGGKTKTCKDWLKESCDRRFAKQAGKTKRWNKNCDWK